MRYNPRTVDVITGRLFSVNDSYGFSGSERIDVVADDFHDADSAPDVMRVDASDKDVLMHLYFDRMYTFDDPNPLDAISIQGPISFQTYFRIGAVSDEGKADFAKIAAIHAGDRHRTEELRFLLMAIPETELAGFGVESLARIVK